MSKNQKIKTENTESTSIPATLKDKERTAACAKLLDGLNVIHEERKNAKSHTLSRYDSDEKGCGCDDSDGVKKAKVDLIVLIDTSGSVGSSARAISNVVSDSIEKAKSDCEPDLEITYLGVDGTWTGTVFSTSHRDYIFGIHGTIPLKADTPHVGYRPEQGANAIEDLSKYAKWREGACRAIFYISDEELDSILPRNDFANETAATNAAIAEANANDVTVFAHHLTYQNLAPQIIDNYKDLCHQTGGEVYFSNSPSEGEYTSLLSEVICKSCGKCKAIKIPAIKPCISINWGDGECDSIETDDHEVMYITVCNCYSNVTFKYFQIGSIQVVDELGNPVPVLPDGTPSVQLLPLGPYCFGDLEPCSEDSNNCVSREFVLMNRGAKAGKYQIKLEGICFDVCLHYDASDCFEFELCSS